MKRFSRIFTVVVFIFLYIPMIVLAVASFNTGRDIAVFEGFTFHQYGELFRDQFLLALLGNSLLIAVLSSLVATVLGTAAALGLHNAKGRLRSIVMTLTNIPMIACGFCGLVMVLTFSMIFAGYAERKKK